MKSDEFDCVFSSLRDRKNLGPNRDDPVLKSDIQKYVSVGQPNAGMVGMAFPGTFMLVSDCAPLPISKSTSTKGFFERSVRFLSSAIMR